MFVEPAVETKDIPVVDDNGIASSDQCLNVGPGIDFALSHGDLPGGSKDAIEVARLYMNMVFQAR